jgi:hypothetical protein
MEETVIALGIVVLALLLIILALLWIVYRQSKGLEVSLPGGPDSPVLPIYERLMSVAERTATRLDDNALGLLGGLLQVLNVPVDGGQLEKDKMISLADALRKTAMTRESPPESPGA